MKKVNQSDPTSTILTEDNLTLLTTDEVAEMLMVGKNRVYELLNKEEFVTASTFPPYFFI